MLISFLQNKEEKLRGKRYNFRRLRKSNHQMQICKKSYNGDKKKKKFLI